MRDKNTLFYINFDHEAELYPINEKKIVMKIKSSCFLLLVLFFTCCKHNGKNNQFQHSGSIAISKEMLMDKIKGGWAGQTIGVTYGGPVEFRFCGTFVDDYQKLPWSDSTLKWWYDNAPGLYDDLYMDLTFVDVFERLGLDAPVDSFASQFAHASYWLWHANQCGRYNILKGIKPPQSGHWLNNPHADCIDFQIEADFAGLMSPGMPNTSANICDKIGHLMNYGDGWYGGVFVASMYSIAFVLKDINEVVKEALKTIPEKSRFYKCISDVVAWHEKSPNDWKQTWFEVQRHYTDDIGCPEGVYKAFDIDAAVNSAYVVIGLLYGQGDFGKTIDIAARCGQDADCNPATAGGILGSMLGYKNIPEKYKKGLDFVENIDFKYTAMSLNKTYQLSFKHALEEIQRNGGSVNDSTVVIKLQKPQPVRFEQSFEGHKPIERMSLNKTLDHEISFTFKGIGFVITGEVHPKPCIAANENYVAEIELVVDGKFTELITMPVKFQIRKSEVCWKYKLSDKNHLVKLKIRNPDKRFLVDVYDAILYGAVQQ
jgi:hypothetical protein